MERWILGRPQKLNLKGSAEAGARVRLVDIFGKAGAFGRRAEAGDMGLMNGRL
jgi:hypothetical protein